MDQTSHGQIGKSYRGDKYNSAYKKYSKGSNINTNLFLNISKTLVKNE